MHIIRSPGPLPYQFKGPAKFVISPTRIRYFRFSCTEIQHSNIIQELATGTNFEKVPSKFVGICEGFEFRDNAGIGGNWWNMRRYNGPGEFRRE